MSQKYTPVAWVDETTSQQGTLINAERLTQMQTAHHYADGFEEVDAIPTEDPGVDYHKMVYCTADATFYRWDGEVWTADIDEDTKHLLDQEIARAEHAEGLIQGYLDAHEANHNNPHQVTKAQVGLGNCDNTADLDKPISTAAQAALDTKADKASTLAGYGITDAYTKAQADTLLAAKADTTALTDGSVTKLGTADLGTDTKPIKLVAGVPTAVGHDLVTTDTAQTITGAKQLLGAYTFKKYLVTYSGATAGYRKLWTFSERGVFNIGTHSVVGQYRALSSARYLVEFYRSTFDSTDNKQTRIYTTANTSSEEMVVGANINPAEGEGAFAIYGYMVASSSAEFLIDTAYNEDGTFKTNFAESSDTAIYSLADIGAIVPVADPYNLGAALDGYAPMVRTTGNQEIAGDKTFKGIIRAVNIGFNRALPTAEGNWVEVYRSTSAITSTTSFAKSVFWGERYRGSLASTDFGLGEIFHHGGTETGWKFFMAGPGLTPADFKALNIGGYAHFYIKKANANTRWVMNMILSVLNGSLSDWVEVLNETVTDAELIAQIEAAPAATVIQ